MQTKSLQLKRALRAALLVLLLGVVGMGKGYASYSFSAVCSTGQTLYYRITGIHYVELVSPGSYNINAYTGFTEPAGNIILPESVVYQGVVYTVTAIGKHAFYNCEGLVGSLTIPNSVSSIGSEAFNGCSGFTSVIIPNSVTTLGNGAFRGCSGFSGNLTIPNSVTAIGDYAFGDCSGFTGVLTIPNTVTSIGYHAFDGCTGFTGILTIPNSVTMMGGNPFSGCSGLEQIIVDSENSVYDSRENCNAIIKTSTNALVTGCKNTVIPNSVTLIGNYAFQNCGDFIGHLIIPNSVTEIGSGAFQNCGGFTGHLTISNSVISISNQAFSGCSGITGLTIGNSVSFLAEDAFENCSSIEQIVVNEENPYFDSRNNCNAIIVTVTMLYLMEKDGLISGCKNTTIPNTVTHINNKAFYGCSGLTSITIPNSVTSIGDEAFYGCSGLTSITIPNSVTSIGNEAFYGCFGLVSIAIPYSVTDIGENVFDNCTSLKEIDYNAKKCIKNIWKGCSEITTVILGDSVKIIKEEIFSNRGNLTTVSIGRSVDSIGEKAFGDNPRLNMFYYDVEKNLEAPTNVFENCPNLTTIHIGPEVQEIGSNIFKGCNTVHFVVALGPTPAVLDAGAFSDIVDNSVLMVSCGNRITYYSVWNMFPFNNIIEDCDTYGINVGAVGNGGIITPSVTEAQMGQEVQITITPNPGMVLVSIKVCNTNDPTQIIPISPTGKSASIYSFTMPPFEVVVMATFKASGTSVGENNSIEASVYPNPTHGIVKVEAEGIKHITISNMLGQVIFNGKVDDDAFEYDFSGQKAGIYLVRIETANGVVVKKVSVAR